MFVLIGFIIVFGCVIGGYLLEEGNIHVLFQPVELLIIAGAATGAFVVQSPPKVLTAVLKGLTKVFSKSMKKENFIEVLSLLNKIFSKMRKEGLIAIENDIENPEESPIFREHQGVMKNHHALQFICDNLKVIISSNISPFELETVMDSEIEAHHKESMVPSETITKIADALPALGIVAAVLGVVLTMGKISEPPAVLGHSIGAALVGTFLGVLLSYGFVGPIGINLAHVVEEEAICFHVIKIALVNFVGGAAPQVAVEFARRVIPSTAKPTFNELEDSLRK
jgi:chemotaxis protein MotA